MGRHRLSPEEAQLWGRLAATVKPLKGRPEPPPTPMLGRASKLPVAAALLPASPKKPGNAKQPRMTGDTLDASWDKRLATGKGAPDRTIDLHGHTLSTAHAMLDRVLGEAIRSGARLVLLVTGRPAKDNPRMPPTGRGVIRASVADWIAAGPHAGQIAAIRNAHPRHGGAGALYLIIRRNRGG